MATLLFVHIPKTGGLSLHYSFEKCWGERVIRYGDRSSLTRFRESSPEELGKYWFLSGHMSLPELRQKNLLGPAISIVRNPIDRFISMYLYLKRSDHPDHANSKFSSLDEFIEHLIALSQHNLHCQRLSGEPSFEKTREIIEKGNLLTVPLEQYASLIEMLRERVQIPIEISTVNVSPELDKPTFNSNQLRRLEPLIDEDNKLYSFLKDRYPDFLDMFKIRHQSTFDALFFQDRLLRVQQTVQSSELV